MAGPQRYQPFDEWGKPLIAISATLSLGMALAFWWHDRWPDFAIFLRSASALRHGLDPYPIDQAPNMNGPLTMWAIRPLTYGSEEAAAVTWLALSLVAGAISARIAMTSVPGVHWLWLVSAILATQAGAMALRQGQLAFILMLAMTCAWTAERRGHHTLAAAILGALGFLKPFYGVFALFYLWTARLRSLSAFIAVFVAGVVASLALGIDVNMAWLDTLRRLTWQAHQANASLPGLAARLFEAPDSTTFILRHTPLYVSPLAKWLFLLVGCGGVAALTMRSVTQASSLDRVWACLGLAAMLLSPLGEVYYLVVIAAPIVSMLPHTRPSWLLVVGLVLISVPYEVVDAYHGSWYASLILNSAYFWGTLALWSTTLVPLCDEESAPIHNQTNAHHTIEPAVSVPSAS